VTFDTFSGAGVVPLPSLAGVKARLPAWRTTFTPEPPDFTGLSRYP